MAGLGLRKQEYNVLDTAPNGRSTVSSALVMCYMSVKYRRSFGYAEKMADPLASVVAEFCGGSRHHIWSPWGWTLSP